MSATAPPVLIVGAGPTGLAAALFLHARGVACRIVERDTVRPDTSRALGVNPRTLSLLEPSGVTAQILSEGRPVRRLHLQRHDQPLAMVQLDFAALRADHPMTILPQARTEALLAAALAERGITPKRGAALEALATDDAVATALLRHADGRTETVAAPVVLAADGAHSVARHALGIGFHGDAYPEPWDLMDLELDGPDPNSGWIDFQPQGVFVALPFSGARWRLIGFGGDLLARLPKGWRAGEIYWRSDFHISHRIADRLDVGRVCLAGDAAHLHSPMGARGMNLGIEDAYVFAACAADALEGRSERLADYGRLRRAVDAKVVRDVRRLTDLVRRTDPGADLLRRLLVPLATRSPWLLRRVARVGMGLDHPVELA